MCKKWTREEFEAKKKALELKKNRKRHAKNNVNTTLGVIATSGIATMFYKIADITY